MIPGDSWGFCQQEFHLHGKTAYGEFLTGTGEVQKLQTNQSHNDDVTNMNG